MADYQIALKSIDELIPYARNSRTHDDEQIALICASMVEFGFTNPVLADDKGIVAGHGRVLAARQLYGNGTEIKLPGGGSLPAGTVPVIDCTGWSDAQRRAYVIADNRLAEKAGWDNELLKLETDALIEDGFDLSLTGFTPDELAAMFALEDLPDTSEKDPNDAPPVPDEAFSKPGDIWVMGPHKVMCSDSTSVDAWDALMDGERADICWCDPPYNVDVGEKIQRLEKSRGGREDDRNIKNDKMGDVAFREFLTELFGGVFAVLKPGGAIYVAHSDRESKNFRQAFADAGFKFFGCLIWRKNHFAVGKADYQCIHEPILYGCKPGAAHKWFGARKQTTVVQHGAGGAIRQRDDGKWAIDVGDQVLVVDGEAKLEAMDGSVLTYKKPAKSAEHPTMKPVELIERHLRNSARPGDIVIDCCGGSGSTMMAADRVGMSSRLMELDPKYVDVIVRRWQTYTGRKAVHAETGEQFPEKP